jgi:Ca2+-binding RTX toxin-like protein
MRPAEAAEVGAAGAGGTGGGVTPATGSGHDSGSAGGLVPEVSTAATTPGAPAIAAGSVLTVGSLIDPSALTRLAGGARFAEAPAVTVGGQDGAVAAPSLPGDPAAPLAADLTLPPPVDLALPSLPSAASAPSPAGEDADLANLGDYVRGGDEDQTIVLTEKDDVFLGGDGNETVLGQGGNDQLAGGGGDDVLDGGAGNDQLAGGSGNDQLAGGSGDDQLAGGSGNDVLAGGTGSDRLNGETGNDVLVLDDPRDAVKELGIGIDGGGSDTIVVADGYARELAQALPGLSPDGRATFVLGTPDAATFPQGLAPYRQQIDPDIENLRLEGSAGHDVFGSDKGNVIEGNLGANHLYGAGGDDFLYGDGGDDWLDGGSGNDWLDGGAGIDTLHGGAGNDVFVLGLHEGGGDQIFDFEGVNSLRLSTADPDAVGVTLQGDDLLVTMNGRTLATIHDYANHADNYAGIDLGEGIRPFDSFLGQPEAAAAPASAAATADWLAGFLPEADSGSTAAAPDAVVDGGPGLTSAAGAPPAATVAFTVPDLTAGGGDFWLPGDSVADAPFDGAGGGLAAADQVQAAGEEDRQNGG